MAKLYELTDAYRAAFAEIEAADGEVTYEMETRLDDLDDAWQEKCQNCGKMYRNLCAEADALKAEERRLYDRRKGLERQAERLKNYVHHQMIMMGERSMKTPLFTFSIRKGRPVVNVTDLAHVPVEWCEVETRARKADILKHWKETGEIISGTEIGDSGESLSIR